MRARVTIVALAILGGMAFPAGTAFASGPLTMTGYSPTSGPVGTVVKIAGTGFAAADIVRFGSTVAQVSAVNNKGTKLTTSVPPLAISGQLTVTDPTTGQTVGIPGTVFLVTTGLFASPNHVWAGGELMLAGSDLTPDSLEQITIGKEQVESARTNQNGDFQVPVSVPWDQPSGKSTIGILDPTYQRLVNILYILGDWPTYRHDVSHSGLDSYETTLSTSSVSKLGFVWSYAVPDLAVSSPAVANDVVYIGDGDGSLYALDPTTGSLDWSPREEPPVPQKVFG